jgi:hypothetical protein
MSCSIILTTYFIAATGEMTHARTPPLQASGVLVRPCKMVTWGGGGWMGGGRTRGGEGRCGPEEGEEKSIPLRYLSQLTRCISTLYHPPTHLKNPWKERLVRNIIFTREVGGYYRIDSSKYYSFFEPHCCRCISLRFFT